MTEKIQVYIINLKKDEDRKKNILIELKKQNIENFELVEAIDGNKLKDEELNLLTYKNKKLINPWNTKMSPSQIGCALSHIKIYKKFIKSNFQFALILEDDAYFLDKFTEDLKKFILKNFVYEKQIILLSQLKEFYSQSLDKINNYEIVSVTNAFFTHSYLINKEAAKSIINFNYPIKTIADNFVFFKIYCGINITGLNPFLLDQNKNEFISTIEAPEKSLKKIFLIKRSLYKMKMKFLKKFNKFKSHNSNN